MKKGIILVNAYYDLPAYLNQAYRLKEEFSKLGITADIVASDGIGLYLSDGKVKLTDVPDFCIYYDKDKYLSQMLEKAGVRLFNPHSAIVACDDKTTTLVALAGNGIPMPDTVSGLLCFTPEKKVSKETLDNIENTLGYPLIAKESYGSLGKGVYKIDDREKLERIAEKLKTKPHLYQKYVATSYGRDMRVVVVGGKTVAAMIRRSNGDFRSNIELGGKGEKLEADERLKALSEKVARLLSLDYCGIDWLFGENGEPVLCEVNSNAFFGGIEHVTGINVAKAYAEHVNAVIYGK